MLARSLRLIASLALFAAVVRTASLGASVLLELHPATILWLLVAALIAVLVLFDAALHGSGAPKSAPKRFRLLPSIIVSVLVLVLAGATWWLRPMPATVEVATAEGVSVEETSTEIALNADRGLTRGFIVQPGAKVAPAAYAPILSELASRCECMIVLIKQPLQVGFLAASAPEDIIAAHPEVTNWAIGGHSLGGVVASRSAQEDERIDELILWASYPSEAVTREGLQVASIWGSEDGLATGEKREETAGLLPADATVTVIEGGIHSFFGDYGIQSGDGNATIPREAAQGQIVEATLAALAG
ncbi:alpha/beta hydrolase [Schaalia hyovaginalis]|uniref:Pimeloyl-ACP methyl ester carboxylesterase n=1 Tax=Schaalia hyovaginalis TaxID=29316 RepID=A0A923E271_9ACTO|nr:alpha/beta hydrolase [Schaalia hyovaginalis]MBB6334509.1 pimeloyl-ACP methyl ester carboxylesterase [Schaalia hyovaginalis]MDY2668648.1 alpha/beta hydrolase [Schaalia hyovaginalis]